MKKNNADGSFCSSCGREIRASATSCSSCGSDIALLSKKETILIEEYKMSQSIQVYEGNLYWERFTAFLAVNSGITALIALLFGISDGLSITLYLNEVLVAITCILAS